MDNKMQDENQRHNHVHKSNNPPRDVILVENIIIELHNEKNEIYKKIIQDILKHHISFMIIQLWKETK